MNLIYGVFLLICCFSFMEGHKLKPKYNRKKLKAIQADLDSLDVKIAKLVEDTDRIVQCLNTPRNDPNWAEVCTFPEEMLASPSARRLERTDVSDLDGDNKDVFWAANMYMGNGDRCGSRQFSNCATTLDTYKAEDATAVVTNTYTTASSCTMTAPVNGYYNICVFARCKKGGNACDFTVSAGTTYAAAFGDAVQTDWRSMGTCFIRLLTAGNTITANLRSGGGSDCIQETNWRYGQMSAYLIVPT